MAEEIQIYRDAPQKPSWLSLLNAGGHVAWLVLAFVFSGDDSKPVPPQPIPQPPDVRPIDPVPPPKPLPKPEGKILSIAIDDSAGLSTDPESEAGRHLVGVSDLPPGAYTITTRRAGSKPTTSTVTIGGNTPTPTPKPNPPQPPKPETGPRTVMIIRESKAKTPDQSALEINLRTGEPAKYLSEKKHSLYVLDPDAKGIDTWRKHFTGEKLPIVLVCSGPLDNLTVLAKAPLPSDTAGVLALLKANGG